MLDTFPPEGVTCEGDCARTQMDLFGESVFLGIRLHLPAKGRRTLTLRPVSQRCGPSRPAL